MTNKLTKIISFFLPITKNIKSDYNGNLELTVDCGKKILNTKNTNYSYGSLQRVLKYSLKQVDLSNTKSILLLGLGGGCVLKTIRDDFHYKGEIIAVDIDPIIIDIAAKEFYVVSDETTKIICSDAFDFVIEDTSRFDLVIVDLFVDNKVPDKFLTQEFWRCLLERINTYGKIIFNTLCEPSTNLQPIKDKLIRRGIEYKLYRRIEKTNKILIVNVG